MFFSKISSFRNTEVRNLRLQPFSGWTIRILPNFSKACENTSKYATFLEFRLTYISYGLKDPNGVQPPDISSLLNVVLHSLLQITFYYVLSIDLHDYCVAHGCNASTLLENNAHLDYNSFVFLDRKNLYPYPKGCQQCSPSYFLICPAAMN